MLPVAAVAAEDEEAAGEGEVEEDTMPAACAGQTAPRHIKSKFIRARPPATGRRKRLDWSRSRDRDNGTAVPLYHTHAFPLVCAHVTAYQLMRLVD